MIDFIAIDLETACKNMNSACAIGIAVVEDLQIVDSFSSLIQPPNLFFEEANIKVHGITPSLVGQAPTFNDLWPRIQHLFSPHIPVVAHNAHFDMSVLHESSNVDIPDFLFLDTIAMVKPFVDGKRGLADCAAHYGLDLHHHHDAADDAYVCAQIAIEVLKQTKCLSMWEFLARTDYVPMRAYSKLIPQKTFGDNAKNKVGSGVSHRPSYANIRLSDIRPASVVTDVTHPLYGKNIVFTGQMSIEREAAMQLAADVGAINKSSVSKKTDYLVVGVQDKSIVGEDGLSAKEEKAYALNAAGKAQIKIIRENEFVHLAKGDALV